MTMTKQQQCPETAARDLGLFTSDIQIRLNHLFDELQAASATIGYYNGATIIGSQFHACVECATDHINCLQGIVARLQNHEPSAVARYCLPWVSDNLNNKENGK